MQENNKSANPPWPGGAASRVRIVVVSDDNAPGGSFLTSLAGSLGVECRRLAPNQPNTLTTRQLYSFENLTKFGSKTLLLMMPGTDASELAAHWLHFINTKNALTLLPNRICEIDVDENGAAIRSWNIQI